MAWGRGCHQYSVPHPDSAVEDNPAWESQRVVLTVFLGGCTFSEIAALRFLGKERGEEADAACGGASSRRRIPEPQREAEQGPCPTSAACGEGGGGMGALSGNSPAPGWGSGRGRGSAPGSARGGISPAGLKFIFLTTAVTNSARMMEAMVEAKA